MWSAVGLVASGADAVMVWSLGAMQNNGGSNDLNTLQLLDAASWSAVQESIAVVESWATSQCLCEICPNKMADVADGTCMVIAQLHHSQHVFVECQTAIQHDSQYFHLLQLPATEPPQRIRWTLTDAAACSWFTVPMTSASDLSGLSWRPFCKYHCLSSAVHTDSSL